MTDGARADGSVSLRSPKAGLRRGRIPPTSVSDEPDIDDPGGARGQRPAAARPGLAPPAKPAAPRLPPPPAFVPPKLGSSKPAIGGTAGIGAAKPGAVVAPSSAAKPASASAPAAASAAKPASTSKIAPPSPRTSVPAPVRTSGPVGLPPPPEFLPRASSAELPLERWMGGDVSEELGSRTLPGIPPLRLGEPAGEAGARDEDEAPLDLTDLEGDAPSPGAASREAEADESDEVDIDVSEDTLPRLAPAIALREPYPSLPHAPSQVPTAPVPVVSVAPQTGAAPPAKAASAAARGRTARILDAPPVAPRRPLGLWIGVGAAVGAVISIVAIMWASSSGPEPEKDALPAVSPSKPVVEVKAEVAPEPAPPPEAKTEVVVPEAKAVVTPEPTPAEPGPTEVVPVPVPEPVPEEPPSEASIITVERDGSDYARALADFKATGSQKSLLDMTTAACALGDGPRARWAFRKLVGKTLRTKAIVACRSSRVDVTSTVEGYTGPELLAQARAALEAGDAKTALDKAHQSNKVERSSEAVLVKALAACKLGDRDQAQRLMPHMSIKARPRLVAGCKDAGIELHE